MYVAMFLIFLHSGTIGRWKIFTEQDIKMQMNIGIKIIYNFFGYKKKKVLPAFNVRSVSMSKSNEKPFVS